jgi:hypothetical protein
VLILLPTVLNVIHQESVSHTVLAQMDSMITVTLVLVVLITVPLVITENLVYLVTTSEKMPQLVNVHPDIMTLVKLNVTYVKPNVKLVIETTSVPLVSTQV